MVQTSQYERDAVKAYGQYIALFGKETRTDAEQIAAADDFRQEMAPVMPAGLDSLGLWRWLTNEARAVLEVDGAL